MNAGGRIMNRRKLEIEQLDTAGFTAKGYRAWAKANSSAHFITRRRHDHLHRPQAARAR